MKGKALSARSKLFETIFNGVQGPMQPKALELVTVMWIEAGVGRMLSMI